LSLIVDRHYDYDGNPDATVNIYEFVFTYQLSNNGNSFLDTNYVRIGINPLTGNIQSVKSKLLALESNKNSIDYKKIDSDFDNLTNGNAEGYYKAYYKEGEEYRPAIYKLNESSVDIIKKY